jgi:hypothetical protein
LFKKFPNIKFYENPSIENEKFHADGQTDENDEDVNRCCICCKAPGYYGSFCLITQN